MSYYASAESRLRLNKYGKEHYEEFIKNLHLLKCVFDEIEVNANGIVFIYYQGNYHEDKVIEALKSIHPYIQNGESIEYLGEDGTEWRFLRSDQGWEEQTPTHVWETDYIHKIK